MKVAKAKGRLHGKQPKLNRRQEAHLVALLKGGEYSTATHADLFGVARSTVYRTVEREPVGDRGCRQHRWLTVFAVSHGTPCESNALFVLDSLWHRSWFRYRDGGRRQETTGSACDGSAFLPGEPWSAGLGPVVLARFSYCRGAWLSRGVACRSATK